MKHIITIISLLLISTSLMTAKAQVKGHTYYAFDAQLGDNIRAEILLEVEDEGHLALGQIRYQGKEEAIRLYGRRERQDQQTLQLEEHLANGQLTGKLTLFLQNGKVKNGEWRSPDGETLHAVMVKTTKSFPYAEHQTFFHPASRQQLGGHFINFYRQGKAFKNDRTLNIMPDGPDYGNFCIEHSGETIVQSYYNQQRLSDNEFFSTGYDESRVTLDFRVFEDFVDVSVVMMLGDGSSKEAEAEGIYIREQGVKEVVTWGIDDIFSIRARLENGVPSLIVNKKRLAHENDMMGEADSQVTPGRHEIRSVQGPVKDIFLTHLGWDAPNPVLCLLLEDGRVQIMRLLYFREHGINSVGEPLGQLNDVRYLSSYNPAPETVPEEEDYDYYEGEGDMEESLVYAVDSQGKVTSFGLPQTYGDFMLNPKNTIDCESFLVLAHDWDMNFSADHLDYQYYGTYWIIESVYDEKLDQTIYTVGFRATTKRSNKEAESLMVPCDERGVFKYYHDNDNYSDIHIIPVSGLNFVPKGKKEARFTYMEAVG